MSVRRPSASAIRALARAATPAVPHPIEPTCLGPALPPTTVRTECVGAHHGQLDIVATAAFPSGTPVAQFTGAVYAGQLHPHEILVEPFARRQGIATRLYEAVLAEHPEASLAAGYQTEAGQAFRRAFDATHGERLTPPLRSPPATFTEADYAHAAAAILAANVAGRVEEARALCDAYNAMTDYDAAIERLSAIDLTWDGPPLPVRPPVASSRCASGALAPEAPPVRAGVRAARLIRAT